MAVAAFLAWRRARWAMALFAIQLLLNAAWSWIFFGLRLLGWALGTVNRPIVKHGDSAVVVAETGSILRLRCSGTFPGPTDERWNEPDA